MVFFNTFLTVSVYLLLQHIHVDFMHASLSTMNCMCIGDLRHSAKEIYLQENGL